AATVFDNSVEGIFITDAAQRILLANRALATLTGFSREELIGQNPRVFNSGRHDAAFFNSMYAQLAATGRWQGEIWNRRKSGEAFPSWMTITAVRGADGALTHYVGVLLDVSERKVQAERIERLAFYDSLTELPNRALFFDRLEQAIAAARRHRQPLALFFLDLDRFKEVNDTHGHAAGDALLVEVARRLQTTLRHEETLARFGGDEFFAFSPGADQAGAMLIAERIVQAFARPFTVHNAEVYCNASLGVALYPGDGASAEALLKAADIALYRAKEAGGYQFYAHEMGVAVARRTELATRLRRALEARQLQLYYQPQIAVKSGALAGAEALARWHDAESGWVSASEFIAIAEERGLIGDLGEWALTEACRQLRAWREAGHAPPGRIAVNVSGRQFREKGFARKMRALVREAALSPAQIELEITETSLLENVEEAARTINALRAAGFTFAIDDFGTGYSSLRYLRQFRAETLKIDMSFVHGVTKNANDRAIIAAVIAMAREVGMKTLAEGVENAAQADALAAMDCDLAQGYYFGHPEPAPAFAARWLRA
ncbi:MAG: putative bifunctional diguanylate cyclase/phosphodiesterase, partial [Burkholderiales bacterium]